MLDRNIGIIIAYVILEFEMERVDKFKLISERIVPNITKLWVNSYTGELIFLDVSEVNRFRHSFKGRFSDTFYRSIKINPCDVTTVPFASWIDEFNIMPGEIQIKT